MLRMYARIALGLALALGAAAALAPTGSAAPNPDCVYIEGGGSFYIDVETGAWRLIAGPPGDFSSDAADELRLRGGRSAFADASGIQPPAAADGRLRGSFEIGGPGEVRFSDRTDGVNIRIADPNAERGFCN
jgi:hypothetical protein